MDWLQVLIPPGVLTAVVIYLVRDLKADLRHFETKIDGRLDKLEERLNQRIDKLAEEEQRLALQVAGLRVRLGGQPSTYPDQTSPAPPLDEVG